MTRAERAELAEKVEEQTRRIAQLLADRRATMEALDARQAYSVSLEHAAAKMRQTEACLRLEIAALQAACEFWNSRAMAATRASTP